MPPETIAAYADVLQELPFDDCAAGCKRLVLSQTFLPSVAEIVAATEACRGERLRLERAERERAERAAYDQEAVGPPPDAVAAMKRLGLRLPPPQEEGHHEAA
jgi:hypothetical protein